MSSANRAFPQQCQANVTTCYVDLAAFSAASAVLYGSVNSITYFAAQTVKATLASQGTVKAVASGVSRLSSTWRVAVNRSGDVLLHSYTLFTVPEVKLTTVGTTQFGSLTSLLSGTQILCPTTGCTTVTVTVSVPLIGAKWVKRLGHHIFKDKCLHYGELPAYRYQPHYADFYLNFAIPADKKEGYLQMIGDVPELTRDNLTWWLPINAQGAQSLPSRLLVIPDLFYYEADTGLGIPMMALPYQDINIYLDAQDLDKLLSLWSLHGTVLNNSAVLKYQTPSSNASAFVGGVPNPPEMATYLLYAILSNDERKASGCGVRDELITQVQEQQVITGNDNNCTNIQTQLNFSHDVINLFFGIVNLTNETWDKSNYTNFPSYVSFGPNKDPLAISEHVWVHAPGEDPADKYQLYYDNQNRVDAFSEITGLYYPYINAVSSGQLTQNNGVGLNMWSYAYKNAFLNQPNGSTAYGRLSNAQVQVPLKSSTTAVCSHSNVLSDYGTLADLWCDVLPAFRCVIGLKNTEGSISPISDASCGLAKQKFKLYVSARNWNPVRIAGGSIGFPIL